MREANASKVYSRVFADFIASVRADFGQPELPFYYVQIGRFTHAGDPSGWNAVQDAQRRLPERVPNTAVVSVIDLELDDAIHVGTHGLKRAGQRLARIAQRELFGQLGAATPTLDRVSRGPHNTLIVKFKGVNMGYPQNAGLGRPVAFGMGGMASANGAAMMGPSQGRGMGGGMGGMGGGAMGRHGRQSRRDVGPGSEARAAHCRLLDPQGRRHAASPGFRGLPGHGSRYGDPQAGRPHPREIVPLVRIRLRPLLQPGR